MEEIEKKHPNYDVIKRSVSTIKQDNLCFPRSVITRLGYFKKIILNNSATDLKLWNHVRRENITVQTKKVLELTKSAGINILESSCNVSHIKQIQAK